MIGLGQDEIQCISPHSSGGLIQCDCKVIEKFPVLFSSVGLQLSISRRCHDPKHNQSFRPSSLSPILAHEGLAEKQGTQEKLSVSTSVLLSSQNPGGSLTKPYLMPAWAEAELGALLKRLLDMSKCEQPAASKRQAVCRQLCFALKPPL